MQTAVAIDDSTGGGRRCAAAFQRLRRALLLGCLVLTGAHVQATGLPVVELPTHVQPMPLDGHVGHLVDREGTLSVEQMSASGHSDDFELPPDSVRSSADGSVHWFKLRLRQDGADAHWVLALPAARNLHEVQLFGPCEESGAARSACDGDESVRAAAVAGSRSPAFLLSPHGSGTFSLYLRVRAGLPQNLSLSISPFAAYNAARQAPPLVYGAGYGLMIGLVLFALLLYWTFRERVYLRFMLDITAALATVALYNGHLGQVLFPEAPWLTDRALLALMPLWIVFGLRQALVYLELRRRVPWMANVFRVLVGACIIAAFAALAGGVLLPSLLGAAAGTLALLLLPIGSGPLRRAGHRFTPLYLFTSGLNCLLALLMLADLRALLPPWVGQYQVCEWATLGSTLLYAGMFGSRLSRVWMKQGELRRRAAELSRAAATDPMTGLANRAGLKERAATLAKTQQAWALLLVDLDHFKPINDTFGHETGDAVLVTVAERLRASVGPHDLAARLGGDEFALLLVGPHEGGELAARAQALIDAISAPIELRGRVHRIGASIGVARVPGNGSELSRLLRGADQALYRAKREGRGTYAFFEGMAPQTTAAATL